MRTWYTISPLVSFWARCSTHLELLSYSGSRFWGAKTELENGTLQKKAKCRCCRVNERCPTPLRVPISVIRRAVVSLPEYPATALGFCGKVLTTTDFLPRIQLSQRFRPLPFVTCAITVLFVVLLLVPPPVPIADGDPGNKCGREFRYAGLNVLLL